MKIISGDVSVELEPDGTLVFRKEKITEEKVVMPIEAINFYGKLTKEEIDRIEALKKEIK